MERMQLKTLNVGEEVLGLSCLECRIKQVMSLIYSVMCPTCEKWKSWSLPCPLKILLELRTTYMKQLANKSLRTAWNAVTVEKLQRICASREQGGNGHGEPE